MTMTDNDLITILREGGAHPGITGDNEIDLAHLGRCNMIGAIRLAYAKGLKAKDGLVEKLMENVPESWDGESSAESILVNYVHALEQRVKALGGNTGAHDGGQHAALGEFYERARKHVTTDDVDDWNDMVDAWERYVQIRKEAS